MIKQLKVKHLKVGMYIADMHGGNLVDNKLHRSGRVTKASTIEFLIKMGVEDVQIDTEKGGDSEFATPVEELQKKADKALSSLASSQPKKGVPPKPKVSLTQEVEAAKNIRKKAFGLIRKVIQDVKMGRSIEAKSGEELSANIIDSIDNNQDALVGLMRIRNIDEYLLEHSINVATLMGVLGRFMGFEGKALQDMVLGAFLHDVGKTKVPSSILDKPGSLDTDEWEEMKRHVDYGVDILSKIDGLPSEAREICAQHHERLDGRGYPNALTGDQIGVAGRMGAIVDVYDAITAHRVYHRGMEPAEALKKLIEWSDNHLDRTIVYQLIRCLGVYPAGSFVELTSGYIAMITEVDYQSPLSSKVVVLFNIKLMAEVPEVVVDLSDKSKNYGKIKGVVDPAEFGMSAKDYYQKVAS